MLEEKISYTVLHPLQQNARQVYGGLDLSRVPVVLPLHPPHASSSAPYKGITQCRTGQWHARIGHLGRTLNLGLFETAEEGALVYARAAYYLAQQRDEAKGAGQQQGSSNCSSRPTPVEEENVEAAAATLPEMATRKRKRAPDAPMEESKTKGKEI